MEKELREILAKINENPRCFPFPASAEEIVKKIRRSIVKIAYQSRPSARSASILDDILLPEYRRRILSAYYFLTDELGFNKSDAVRLIINSFEILMGTKQFKSAYPVEETIIEYVIDILEGEETYSSYPFTLLDYASELALIYWDGEKWNITELGKFFLKLPPLEFSKALLTLEITFSRGTPNCMTFSFLELLKKLFYESDVHKVKFIAQRTRAPYLYVLSWLHRLASLGVVILDYGRRIVKANPHTVQILSSILDKDSNPYFSLFSALITSQDPPLIIINLPSHITMMKNDSLIKHHWKEIEQALNSFQRGDYHATLRTMLPVIESILRDISIQEKIAGTNKGLKALLGVVKGHKLISDRAEGLIKALGRDVELHGLEQLDFDRARFYAELSLMALIELIRDYRRHKLLHKALSEIAKQLNMNLNELIKAYPEKRNIVHVQFLSDNAMRVTIKGKFVFEVKKNKELRIASITS